MYCTLLHVVSVIGVIGVNVYFVRPIFWFYQLFISVSAGSQAKYCGHEVSWIYFFLYFCPCLTILANLSSLESCLSNNLTTFNHKR